MPRYPDRTDGYSESWILTDLQSGFLPLIRINIIKYKTRPVAYSPGGFFVFFAYSRPTESSWRENHTYEK